jgi:hypothetical protein
MKFFKAPSSSFDEVIAVLRHPSRFLTTAPSLSNEAINLAGEIDLTLKVIYI